MSIHQPIQLPVQTFTSADTGAPQLTAAGAAGEIKTILKACLSTGYGSKAAATGWSMPFEDANKAVFKSTDPRATGFCLRIDNDKTKGGQVTCYETMTGVNTGVKKWFDHASGFVTYRTHTNVSWRIYVTPVNFLMLTETPEGHTVAFFFGDLMTTKTNDLGNCHVFAMNQYSNAADDDGGGMADTYSYDKSVVARNGQGQSVATPTTALSIAKTATTANIYNGHHGYPVYLSEANAVRLMPPWLSSNKREKITAAPKTIAGRNFYVTNIGAQSWVYLIPVDYWLL